DRGLLILHEHTVPSDHFVHDRFLADLIIRTMHRVLSRAGVNNRCTKLCSPVSLTPATTNSPCPWPRSFPVHPECHRDSSAVEGEMAAFQEGLMEYHFVKKSRTPLCSPFARLLP